MSFKTYSYGSLSITVIDPFKSVRRQWLPWKQFSAHFLKIIGFRASYVTLSISSSVRLIAAFFKCILKILVRQ